MGVNTGQKALIELAEEIKTLAEANPCGWNSDKLTAVADTLKALISLRVRVGMSREQLARYLGVSTRTIQRRVREGRLPQPHHDGHKEITFYLDEVDRINKLNSKH